MEQHIKNIIGERFQPYQNLLATVTLAITLFSPASSTALPTLPDSGNLLYWFSADTGVWSDSNATTAATDGVDVQVWRDQISNLEVTAPATSSDRSPTYVVNGIGNQPSLDFNTNDGGIDAMLNNSIASNVTAKTIFIVFQPNSEITTSDPRQVLTDGWSGLEMLGLGDFHGSANANATTKSVIGLTSKTTTSSSQGVGVGYGPAKLSAAQPHVLTAVWNINTQKFDLYLDGINVGNSRRFLTADTNGFSLQELTIGARNLGALDGFEGMISEVIFYKTSLSDSNRLEVGSYLSNKYLVPSLNKAFHFSADTEVWSDAAATTAATDGQDVQLWQDQSANSIDLIPSHPGINRAATYRENGINRKPALQFNNETAPNETTPDKMQNTGYNGTLKTLFYVFQPDQPIRNTTDLTQRQVLLFGGSEINTVSPHDQVSSAHIGLSSYNGTVNRAWGYDPADSLDIPAYPTVLSISWHASDEQYDLRMNGASVGNLASGTDPNAFVMSGLFVGAHSSGVYGLQGLVAEIIAYESELPTGQRDAIEQYLKGKYAAPNIYYVDASNGIDEDSGLSPTSPWKSFDRINDSLLIPGDTILLKRGETWRETITVPSSGSPGLPITFRAYGNGAKPIIHGGRPGSESWLGPDGNNVYSMENQPAGVYFMAESNELIKYASDASCNDGNWFREGAENNVAQKTGTIYYKPTTEVLDPNAVEFVTTYVGILVRNQSYIEFYDLALTLLERGIYPYALDTSVQNIKISNSDFSKIGNGIIFIARNGNESAQSEISDNTFSNNRESIALYAFSNGVEISRNFLVTRNTLLNAGMAAGSQLWHDFASGDWEGIGFQNLNDSVISHNHIDGPGVSVAIDLWTNSQSTAKNNQYIYNYIENIYGSGIVPGGQNGTDTGGHTVAYNIVINSGYGAIPYGEGWGALRLNAPQDPPTKIYNNLLVNNDIHINFNASSSNYQLFNNISYSPANYHAFIYDPLNASTLNNNLYFPDSANGFGKSNLPSMDFSGWKTYTNQDIQGSLISDPGFVSTSAPYDFRLTANSPAIDPILNVQVALGLSNNYLDYDEQFILWNPDIGPYEYQLTDTDADGLLDMTEICYDGDCSSYDPYNAISNPSGGDLNANAADGDGTSDGDEIAAGTDPLNSASGAATSAVSAPTMGLVALILLWLGLAGIGIRCSKPRLDE